jgi:HAD superfamily phosphatase (TIGR01681 family)
MLTLQEALKYIRESRPERFPLFDVALLCSFTPLHLKTFLTASLLQRLPERRVECGIGVYGDLLGALQTISDAPKTAAIVIEWADLDPRLGLRRAAGWLATGRDDIVNHASARLRALAAAITPLQRRMRVVVVAPTLPLPPFPITATIQLAPEAMALHSAVARFVTEIGRDPNVVILDPAALDRLSPVAERHDPRGEFAADFPYGKRHAAALAELMARLLAPQAPLKGIITDLDDTLWRGIVGDVGTDGVSWSLDGHGQGHALYQQTLASLAETGALLAIASKNQPEVAQAALKRPDMLIAADRFFPQEISWGPKSASVKAILDTWNVSADSVVFI